MLVMVAHMGRIIVFFPLLEACIASSGTMKASLQKESFQLISSLNPSNVHCVFSNRDLPSTSVRQPRAIAMAYIVWEFPGLP